MKNIIIVVGSARKVRVADKIVQYVQDDLAKRNDINATVVDLEELHLPFYNNELAPSAPDFHEDNEAVHTWSKKVSDADAVLMITPEYNHNLSAIQKNAIDWLFAEWENKPVAVVAYGWYAGVHSIAALRELAPVVKMDLKPAIAQLGFTKELNPDGTLLDEPTVRERIKAAIDEIA